MLEKIINTLLFLLYTVSTIALSANTFVFDNIIYPKWLCCYFTIIILLALCTMEKILGKRKQDKKVKLHLCLILPCTIVLSVLLFRDIDAFIKVLAFVSLLFYFYAMDGKYSHVVQSAIIAGGLLNVFVGLYKYIKEGNLMTGTYDSHVGYSLSIALAIITILHYVFNGNWRPSMKIFSITCSLFLVCVIVYSKSRVGILALAVCFSFFFLKKKILLFSLITLLLCISLLFKSESTKGRYFIYKATLSVLDTPKYVLIGKGKDGFRKSYMLHQAKLLNTEPESVRFRADNIKHPLNEFLLLYVNYGILFTLLCIITLFWVLFHLPKSSIYSYLLMIIIVYSLFAYPFHYPITWLTLAWIFSSIKNQPHTGIGINSRIIGICHIATFLLLLNSLCKSFSLQNKWSKTQNLCYIGLTGKAHDIYKNISKQTDFGAFHYNYASFLNIYGMNNEASIEIEKCNIIDYDTQLLRGKISESNMEFSKALHYYMEASSMCPNRFVPLYSMFRIYDTIGDYAMRNKMAQYIMNKKVKIESSEIESIKKRVKFTLQ